jgi:hypothetical protein
MKPSQADSMTRRARSRRVLLRRALLPLLGLQAPALPRDNAGTSANAAVLHLDMRQGLRSEDWEWQGNGRWQVTPQTLTLAKAGTLQGSIRKPAGLAILREPNFEQVSLSARIRSTAPPTLAERDLLFVFGYQSPTRFYYAHLSAKADAIHTGIFLVADADRRRLDAVSAQGVMVDQGWHAFRLEWHGGTGSIDVFRADQAEPLLRARDKTLNWGRVGFGSFDDTGEFSDVVIHGRRKLGG